MVSASDTNCKKHALFRRHLNIDDVNTFPLSVTNGIYWLKDLVLKIVIIPENLYMKSQRIHVEEGKFVKVRERSYLFLIFIINNFFI